MNHDVVVIGAGAAGLMAAGTAACAGMRVLLLEKMEKPARKVRITGKGRCNITNMHPAGEFLSHVKTNASFFAHAFSAFDNAMTVDFFNDIGLRTALERGRRVFPASNRAWDAAEALSMWCGRSGVGIACGHKALRVEIRNGRVCGVATSKGVIKCGAVILATGGASYPATGSTGDGYAMAHALGHRIEPLRPSLVSLRSGHKAVQTLKGTALKNISASLEIDGKADAVEFGEAEFLVSRSGRTVEIGGAAVLRLSRRAVAAVAEGCRTVLIIDFKPALSIPVLKARILREKEALPRGERLSGLLRKLLPAGAVSAVASESGLSVSLPAAAIDDAAVARIASTLKSFRFPVSGHAPLEEAIVTAGGVDVGQVDPLTMGSRVVGGLYFAGEVLDLDADTGGYNLQIAFSTGRLAGSAAAKEPKG